MRTGRDVGLLCLPESRTLRARPVAAAVGSGAYVLPPRISAWALGFLAQRVRESTIFDGQVVGLASDVPVDDRDTAPVQLRRCGYFDFICTNILSAYDVQESGHGVVLPGRSLVLDRRGRLRTLRDSWLANIIGVSTMAFTADGALIVVSQTARNASSQGLVAPSGSGAPDQRDLRPTVNEPLQQFIIRATERELREEARVKESEIQCSEVIGFGRWLSRGANPEFSTVTLLNVDSYALTSRSVVASEREYVAGVQAVNLIPYERWSPDAPLEMLPEPTSAGASFPLALALSALAECIHDPSWTLGSQLRDRLG